MRKFSLLVFLVAVCLAAYSQQQSTQCIYLSGKGTDDAKKWGFVCSAGMKASVADSINVPCNWELQGFGEYTYGRYYKKKGAKPSRETGLYTTVFKVPETWRKTCVRIVFDGSMTDTEVKINGVLAGEIHQGAFYRFSYDISDKLKYGTFNKLEVKVSKESDNKSINAAERKADWWLFGGIFRPVYLESKPKCHIDNIASDARADGNMHLEFSTSPLSKGYSVEAEISPVKGKLKKQILKFPVDEYEKHNVSLRWKNVDVWTPETPNLYNLKLTLLDEKNRKVHTVSQRIGFRTMEFRAKDGFYLNGTKLVMRGINRHSFHPETGRATNKNLSIEDVKLIKEMNMNAVRMHYSADTHFFDACDSLGLLVMDELCGWQNGYDKIVAPKLLREMIERDVNHPSIIIWSNGNEGGWSSSVDNLFDELDPQKRHVVHPWADYNNVDTHHYPAYLTGIARFTNGYKVFLPTEFMHGMYDQGHGAGLEDFWENYISHPLFAGGFMWDFSDNAVRRTDKNNILDADGSNAADGILGAYREKEASYYAVREIWAPIQFDKTFITSSFKGEFLVENRFLFTDLKDCSIKYRVLSCLSPLQRGRLESVEIAAGDISVPSIGPGCKGKIKMMLPEKFSKGDVLELTAYNPDATVMCVWSWPIKYAGDYFSQLTLSDKTYTTMLDTAGSVTVLKSDRLAVTFSKEDGRIVSVVNKNDTISFADGPISVGMKSRIKSVKAYREGQSVVFVAKYYGGIDSIKWTMDEKGLLSMDAVMLNRASGGGGFDDSFIDENISNFGISFSYPESKVKGAKWFGKGPYRVWKNRQRGQNYNIWTKNYNDAVTGECEDVANYPEFKGYHSNIYWLTLINEESDFTVYSKNDGLFVRLFTPSEPKNNYTGWKAYPEFPVGDISFLYEIPAIRSFKPVLQQGPHSQPGMVRIKKGDEGIKMNLVFNFRK